MERNLSQDTVIKKVLTTEVRYIIGIATFIIGVVAPYYSIKQDVALIKENHYAHIEQLYKEVKELKEAEIRDDAKYTDLLQLIYDNK